MKKSKILILMTICIAMMMACEKIREKIPKNFLGEGANEKVENTNEIKEDIKTSGNPKSGQQFPYELRRVLSTQTRCATTTMQTGECGINVTPGGLSLNETERATSIANRIRNNLYLDTKIIYSEGRLFIVVRSSPRGKSKLRILAILENNGFNAQFFCAEKN